MAWCNSAVVGSGQGLLGPGSQGGFLEEVLLAFHGGCKPDYGRAVGWDLPGAWCAVGTPGPSSRPDGSSCLRFALSTWMFPVRP